ncbi:MAG: protein kinase [Candidatus Melainabacteria bacterium]|nr:protein kinase [Candidatus Melainabacteria bacterium]
MPEDSPKTIVAERYTVEKEIGRGGMGVVLKAHDKTLDITVAIKLLGKDPTGQGAARLQREATAAGKLKHQNIARVFDFGQTDDSTPYMVMEYLEGQTLADLIKEIGKLDCKTAIPIFAQVAAAMSYAHNNGVIHRDIKPSNVLLVELEQSPSQVKLLDFGVASIVNDNQHLTRTGAIVGSPLYMSSEQTLGEDATSRSDIYSFGCLMFETLTGQVPFMGSSALETMSMHRSSAPPLLSDLISVQMVPNDIVLLIDECLRKSPQNRPADFAAVLDRLKTIQESLENKTLSAELIQKISNQHFKIRLHQFWKSRFGALTVLAILCALLALGYSVFKSEHRRVAETKTVPKRSAIENPLLKDGSMISPKGTIGSGLRYIDSSDSAMVSADDSVTDSDLIVLKNKRVNVAYLDHGAFDGSGLQYLNPDTLTYLSIKNSGVKSENLKYLRSMKLLRTLQIGSPFISDDALKNLQGLSSLEFLNLRSDKITNSGIKNLESLPIQEFSIQSIGITDEVTNSLQKMKNLQILHLLKTSVGADIGVRVAQISKLNELYLAGTSKLSAASFKALSKLNLITLGLSGVEINEEAFKEIAKIKTLQKFVIGDARFDSRNLHYLNDLPELNYLDFSNSTRIDDDLIASLDGFKNLKILYFNDSNITEKQFLKLTRLRQLTHLEVLNTNISEETFEIFKDTFKRVWKRDFELEGSEKL